MARPLRIERIGCWYHFTARGNERCDIFRDDKYRAISWSCWVHLLAQRFAMELEAELPMLHPAALPGHAVAAC
jgi:hypothetical protein